MIKKNGQKYYSVFDDFEEEEEEYNEEEEEDEEDPFDTEQSHRKCENCDYFDTEYQHRLYGSLVSEFKGWCTVIENNIKIVDKTHHCGSWSGEDQNVLNKDW